MKKSRSINQSTNQSTLFKHGKWLSVRMEQAKCYYIELSASRYLKIRASLRAMKLLKQLPYATAIYPNNINFLITRFFEFLSNSLNYILQGNVCIYLFI